MTTIATFPTPEDAHLFRAFLGSRGMDAYLKDEHLIQFFWFYSSCAGGVKVDVMDSDAENATDAYRTYMKALRSGPYPLNPVRAWPLVFLLSLIVSGPVVLFGRRNRSPETGQ